MIILTTAPFNLSCPAVGIDAILTLESPNAQDHKEMITSEFPEFFTKGNGAYLTSNQPSIARQRNLGIAKLQTDIASLPDDDAYPDPDYCTKIAEVFENDPDHIIAGVQGTSLVDPGTVPQIKNHIKNTEMQKDYEEWHRCHMDGFFDSSDFPGNQKALPKSKVSRFLSPKLFLYGWGMNYRTKLFDEFSFDESFRGWCLDDIEIGLRISKSHLNVQRTDAITDHVRISRGHTCPLRLIAMMLQYSYLLKKNEVNESTWKRQSIIVAIRQLLESNSKSLDRI